MGEHQPRYETGHGGREGSDPAAYKPVRNPCCNPDCDHDGTLYVGDLTTLGDYACSLCEVYIVGDGNDD